MCKSTVDTSTLECKCNEGANPAAFAGYRYREPTMIVGDSIDFRDNNGNLLHGTCTFIRTHYSSKYEAYHIYSMLVDGHKRQRHVGEENLVR